MFSDESTFDSIGHLNRHNSHYLSAINPHWMQQIDNQHRWNINVWCGIINGNVNSESYLNLIENELPILLEHVDMNTRYRMWLQQDGAPPHYARIVRNFLYYRFPNRWIGNVNSESYLNLIENELPILLEHLDMKTRYRMWLQQVGAPPYYARIVRNFLNDRFPNRWIGPNGVQNPIVQPPRGVCRVTLMPKINLWVLNIKFVSMKYKHNISLYKILTEKIKVQSSNDLEEAFKVKSKVTIRLPPQNLGLRKYVPEAVSNAPEFFKISQLLFTKMNLIEIDRINRNQ
ncbi:hypothetical protein TSAR_015323 [Trichomalopsis sarcophagae]|uniref:Uncharacterized protein n=1 Tax=Trichomalopsis sarcophagae TaxID=543379 RepID=A0A232EPG2_9HYME|nr:hypothetical protein TSAR_015323 [Trichomalopsis sarcophagae]